MTPDIFKLISGDHPSKKIRRPQIFKVGEPVRIISGAFAGFDGRIERIDKSCARLLVRVKIFGRTQAVKMGFMDAENISDD